MCAESRSSSRATRTRARLLTCALELFERQGYDDTTVMQIAQAAGVSHMTFFRYFPTKESIVVDDPYDEMIVAAVAEQPRELTPAIRAARGVRRAWQSLPNADARLARRRVSIVGRTPTLRAAAWRATAETERLITEQLVTDGTSPLRAGAASAAVLAAAGAALFEWARQEDASWNDFLEEALGVMDFCDG